MFSTGCAHLPAKKPGTNVCELYCDVGEMIVNFVISVTYVYLIISSKYSAGTPDLFSVPVPSLIPTVLPLLQPQLQARPRKSCSLHCQVPNQFCCSSDPNRQGEAVWRNERKDDRHRSRQMEGMRHRVPNSGKVLRERFVLLSSATLHCPSFSLLPCLLFIPPLSSLLSLFDFPGRAVICFVLC